MRFTKYIMLLSCFVIASFSYAQDQTTSTNEFTLDGKFGVGGQLSIGGSHFLVIPEKSDAMFVYPMVSTKYHISVSKFFNRIIGVETGFGINNVGFNQVFDFDGKRSTKNYRFVSRGFFQSYSIPVLLSLRAKGSSSCFFGIDNTFFRKSHYFVIESFDGSKTHNTVYKRNKGLTLKEWHRLALMFSYRKYLPMGKSITFNYGFEGEVYDIVGFLNRKSSPLPVYYMYYSITANIGISLLK